MISPTKEDVLELIISDELESTDYVEKFLNDLGVIDSETPNVNSYLANKEIFEFHTKLSDLIIKRGDVLAQFGDVTGKASVRGILNETDIPYSDSWDGDGWLDSEFSDLYSVSGAFKSGYGYGLRVFRKSDAEALLQLISDIGYENYLELKEYTYFGLKGTDYTNLTKADIKSAFDIYDFGFQHRDFDLADSILEYCDDSDIHTGLSRYDLAYSIHMMGDLDLEADVAAGHLRPENESEIINRKTSQAYIDNKIKEYYKAIETKGMTDVNNDKTTEIDTIIKLEDDVVKELHKIEQASLTNLIHLLKDGKRSIDEFNVLMGDKVKDLEKIKQMNQEMGVKLKDNIEQKENKMEKNSVVKRAYNQTKVDLSEAAKRTAVSQTIRMIREPLIDMISSRMGKTKKERGKAAEFLSDLFASEIGEALLCAAIGAGLEQIPVPGVKKEVMSSIATEIRIQGYTKVGMMTADFITGPVVEILKNLSSSAEVFESKVRLAESTEVDSEVETENLEKAPAKMVARAKAS